jgi:hypothetical protein
MTLANCPAAGAAAELAQDAGLELGIGALAGRAGGGGVGARFAAFCEAGLPRPR